MAAQRLCIEGEVQAEESKLRRLVDGDDIPTFDDLVARSVERDLASRGSAPRV